MEALVIPFEKLRMNDVEQVGGKNSSLGEMISQLADTGVRVPGGFATTAHAYRVFLSQSGLDAKINAALDALELVGLAGREELACRYLSQGQKRRVALARLVNERRALWILDEPYVALDAAAVELVAGLIGAHLQRGGLAVLTTHQAVPVAAATVRELILEAPSGVRQG